MTEDIERELERIDGNVNGLYEQIKTLRDENDDLRRRIAELEEIVNPDPENQPDQLTKEQKVRKLRKALIQEALDGHGRATMKYDEVRALFDMSIAPSYSYDLMDAAGRMEGFAYDRAGQDNSGQKRIRVDIDAVNDETLIHSVKNETQTLPA